MDPSEAPSFFGQIAQDIDAAAGWLMTTLDPTPSMVALVQAATTLPVFLLAVPAGALADRADRRRLLMLVQSVALGLAVLLGVLVLLGAAGSASLLAITFGLGVITAISVPLAPLRPRISVPAAPARLPMRRVVAMPACVLLPKVNSVPPSSSRLTSMCGVMA